KINNTVNGAKATASKGPAPKTHVAPESRPTPKNSPLFKREPKAVAIASEVAKTVDPENEWGKISGLRFHYRSNWRNNPESKFTHVWDLKSGRYRVEGRDSGGTEKISMFKVGDKVGEGWVRMKFTESPPENPAHNAQ